MATKKTTPKKTVTPVGENVGIIHGAAYPLFNGAFANGVLAAISDTTVPAAVASEAKSNTGGTVMTIYPHPLNIAEALKLKDVSSHHCACIQAKKYGTVGLGFVDDSAPIDQATTQEDAQEAAESLLSGRAYIRSAVDDKLDPMTHYGFATELLKIAEDYEDSGTGYMEVVRNSSEQIVWLGHVPSQYVYAVTKDRNLYYLYRDPQTGATKYFSGFGKDKKAWLVSPEGPYHGENKDLTTISEIIPFICPSNRVMHYGYPEWLSASVDIDLLRKAKQYKADFYHNRGVMDFIVAVTGETVDTDKWSKIETAIRGTSGMGNNFKSLALNLGNENAKLQVVKMASEQNTEEQFSKDNEVLSQNIVSAHRLPPLLANILIPGKMGGNNEFVNALIAAQLLVFGPRQNIFQSTLGKTLARPTDGIVGMKEEAFRLRTITSQISITGLDTVGRMRSQATDPANKDRDMNDGVLD